jgi:hypothetical protein
MTSRIPDKVSVVGAILLGEELLLQQESTLAQNDPDVRLGRPINARLSPAEWMPAPDFPEGDVEYKPISTELKPTSKAMYIKDEGLMLQYGIIGKPGTGKTHLLTHILRQLVAHKRRDPDRKFGGLILDPKSALIDGVTEAFEQADRPDDLIIVNTRELRRSGGVNVLHCMLSGPDLGEVLVMAAQSAGLAASDKFWLLQMSSAFGAILTLLSLIAPAEAPSLRRLMDIAVGNHAHGSALDAFVDEVRSILGPEKANHIANRYYNARDQLLQHAANNPASSDPKIRSTVEMFMQSAFSVFRDEGYESYSTKTPANSVNLYDRIVNEGKVVLVSMGPQEVAISSRLPALMKLIFQRTVISRFERYKNWEIHNFERPVFLIADEYHQVATKVEGIFGDTDFFSMARQFGAFCLVATQSLQQLKVSSIEHAWPAVFDVLAAIISMWGDDPDTTEYINKRAGKLEYEVRKRSTSVSDGKENFSFSVDRVERPVIPVGVAQMLVQGQAIVVGKTEGQTQAASVRYLKVPAR